MFPRKTPSASFSSGWKNFFDFLGYGMRSEEYLNEIRKAAGLCRAVLQKITAEGSEVTFHLTTDCTYSKDDCAYAEKVSARYVPEGFTAKVRVRKSVPDEAAVARAVADILRTNFPAAAAFISPQDIEVSVDDTGGRFFIGVSAGERAQFSAGKILDELNARLQRMFCGAWYGGFRDKEKELGEIDREELPPAETEIAARCFPVVGYEAIDGAAPERAVYIADLTDEAKDITVCGTVSYIEEKQTKNGKPYFSVSLTDGSGQLRASYFSKKATVEKVRGVKQGDSVCLTGDNEIYNGGLSLRVKAIDYGAPPEGYEFQPRPSRPAPAKYQKVFPEPVNDYVQADLFGETPLPDDFKRERFVVFDLETTGLNTSGSSGNMDRIIEVGAVKIENGKICEKFSTFVACPVRLSQEIIAITGIDDGMLVGAPDVKEVIADFYKFCEGCTLVGHNVQFDIKFVCHYGEREGYLFGHKQLDTLILAQEQLRLSNYKLNTVADHYGFTFHHHRAFDDAFVTAKIFMELVKERGNLPK